MIITLVSALLSLGLGLITYFSLYFPNPSWIWMIFLSALIYFIVFIFLFIIFLAAFGSFYKILNRPDKENPNRFGMFILEQACFILVHLFNGHPHFSGRGKLPPRKQRFCLVSNHLSGWDHLGLISLFAGKRMICVSKRQNEEIFAAGSWIRYAGYLSIDQHDILQGQQVIDKAASLIENGTCSVAIAPEGTRNKSFPDPMLLPFHPGSFQMAVKAKCPIVVIAIQNTNALFQRFPRWSNLYYDCVAVLEYDTYKDWSLSEISAYCHNKILERLQKKQSRFYHLKKKEESK